MSETRSDTTTYNKIATLIKFIVMSTVGVIYFFVPVIPGADGGQTPLVWSLAFFKALIAPIHNWLLLAAIVLLLLFVYLGKTGNHPFFKKHFGDTSTVSLVFYVLGLILAIMVMFQVGPQSVICDPVGGEGFALGKSVMITIVIAGFMIPFLVDYGLLDFIGALINPLMRSLFRLPGESSIDAVTSFVSSATVGLGSDGRTYSAQYKDSFTVSELSTDPVSAPCGG